MVAEQRREYIFQLEKYIHPVVDAFAGLGRVSLEYSQGWPEGQPIIDVLLADKERDIATGTTSHGAQRADLRVYVDEVAAADSLSRGQSKLLVYALKLAQAAHYQATKGHSCVFLLDDLPAELDYENRKDVLAYLHHLGCQYFVTGVDKKDFDGIDTQQSQLFHVEHGVFSEA
jgi:DNA replication and repair protein RecF